MNQFSMSGATRTHPIRRVMVLMAVVATTLFGVVSPVSAQVPVPRLLPTSVPSGYAVDDYFDRVGPERDVYFIHILRNSDNTREYFAQAIPITKTSFDDNILASRVRAGGKKIKVRGLTGVVTVDGPEVYVEWFERNRWMQVVGTNVSSKATVAFAALVVPSKAPDASFALKRKPAGYTTTYVGQAAGLTSSASGLLWTNASEEEVELYVANSVPNYIDIVYLSPGSPYVPTSVNGKPGYVSRRETGTTIVWMEQPNLLVRVRSTEFNEAGVLAFAASLAPVDENAWKTAIAAADQTAPPPAAGGTTPVNTTPVAAGTLNGVPWVATVNGQCLVFAAGGATSEACIPGFTATNSLAWNTLAASGKTFAVGITGANVLTVVAKANGAEIARTTTQPVAGVPGLSYFIVELPNATGVTVSGLDGAGVEIAPAVPPTVK